MLKLFVSVVFFTAIATAAQTDSRDSHFREEGTNVIFARSAFAHGYRHGYEEGYHSGNIDINMGRQARTSKQQLLHGISRRYSNECGPRKSFDSGFMDGLKAGYADGYAGHSFRAVETFRMAADSLSQSPAAADPRNLYFDQGFSAGYDQGFTNFQKDAGNARLADFRMVTCADFHPAKQQDSAAQVSFCEGFRRGYTLGHADALIVRPDHSSLEASK
jgi:hypothetical protein